MKGAYYNERDKFAAAWLRELIRNGLIAPGEVDERSIADIRADDLAGFGQHHFFAGIGVWSYALRLAGWPDDRPVWTGSCPCQPFSAAGKRAATADARHLWPVWERLVRECRPERIFGEQVEGAVRLGWLDLVFGDLEGEGYACGAAVLGAHSVGAPHIRQRLYWVADASGTDQRRYAGSSRTSADKGCGKTRPPYGNAVDNSSATGWLAHPHPPGLGVLGGGGLLDGERPALGDDPDGRGEVRWSSATAGFWRDPDWLACRDGRWRPVESGTFPLVDGSTARVVVACAYCKTETRWIDGAPSQIDTVEVLQILRREDGAEKTALRPTGGTQFIQQKEVLQSAVFRIGVGENADDKRGGAYTGEADLPPNFLQSVRNIRTASGSSSRSESVQQPTGQSRDAMPDVSPGGASGADAAIYVRGLRNLIRCAKSSQPHENLFCPVCEGVRPHQRSQAMGSRVGELRGYGNAIVAEQAATFIKAYMDAAGA